MFNIQTLLLAAPMAGCGMAPLLDAEPQEIMEDEDDLLEPSPHCDA
jgi:hypothetical protein